jgi:hypothetical protein
VHSSYPAQRTNKDEKGVPCGVVGTVNCVASAQLAEQTIISYLMCYVLALNTLLTSKI